MMIRSLFFSLLIGGAMTLFCLQLLKPLAAHIGLLDTPGGRKRHAKSIPVIGGIAIFVGFCFALLSLDISLHDYRGLLAGSALLVLLGILDDFKELSPRVRLFGQCLAALFLVCWGHILITKLGNLFSFGELSTGFLALPLTVLFVLAFVNAINMIDGNDGLAASVTLFQALFLMYLCFRYHQRLDSYVLTLFSVVLFIFLLFNFPLPWRKQASVFLGDAGSTFLGFVIICFGIDISQVMLDQVLLTRGFNGMTVIWVLAYPFYDLMIVTTHRILSGKSPLRGGRDHLHHLLIDLGLSRISVTLLLLGVSVFLGTLGILLAQCDVSESRQLFVFGSAFIVYWVVRLTLYRFHRISAQ